MKSLFLLITLFFAHLTARSQNLSLTSIFSLCNKPNWDEVNEYLLKKNWEYYSSSKGDDEHYNTISWAYNKVSYSDKAQGWFYLYTFEGLPNKITYLFFNKASYNTIKAGITAAGMKLIENSIEDNELVSKYAGAFFTISVKTAKKEREESYSEENSITAYSVEVIKKAGVYDTDNGKKTDYYEDGQIKTEYYLTNGRINGQLKVYQENGNLQKVGTYLNGKENGKFIEYDEEGIKTAEYPMVNGEVNGVLTIYKDGLKSQEITKQNGINNGKFVAYYYSDKGKLNSKVVGQFLDEKKNGLWQTFLVSKGKEVLIEFTTYSNDEKNGVFKEYVNSDSLETGTYKDGILNGYFTRKTKLKGYEGKNFENEVTWWNLECEGTYIDGVENGKWIYYLWGGKSEEGNYENGEKNGKWTNYIRIGNHADEVLMETNYKNGKENGLFKQYFKMQTVSDSAEDGNPSIKFVNLPIQESYYYINGVMEGEYVLKDSSGILISKGNYSNDKKNGLWLESFLMDDTNRKSNRVYQKGNYINDKRTGTWNEYIEENSIMETQTYKDGELDGKLTRFYENKKPSEVFELKKGQLISLEEYDTLGNNILYKYQINSIKGKVINCLYLTFENNISTTQGYEFINSSDEFNFYDFDINFILSVGDTDAIVYDELYHTHISSQPLKDNPSKNEFISNPISYSSASLETTTTKAKGWKKEGLFEISETSSKKIFASGNYKNHLKNGTWRIYYYENDTYIEQEFKDGIGDVEKYYSISSQNPFSGKFELRSSNSIPKCEFKISNGLRNGKSKYFDKKGKEIKTEKYVKGILKV
jgi:antitoxin component YwqK of YwqJK toxin-antitoxin module